MNGLERAANAIKKAETIAIASHINPDGDSIGSLLSLGEGVKRLGKKVHMISYNGVPRRYRSLPGAGKIKRNIRKKVDLAISVDCNSPEIIGPPFRVFKKAKDILAIDHHEIREPFEDIAFIDEKAAAVGEMVYALLKKLKVTVDKRIAENILTSLIVETGSFRLPNVSPFTFKLCSELVKTGVDYYKLVDAIFWSASREETILSGICMARSTFIKRGRLVWTIARKKDFRRVHGKDEDVDALADELRAIRGVEIVVFFREKSKEDLRVSLRSKKDINIALLAKEYGGGGHSDVAGCIIPNTPLAMKKLIKRAAKFL